VRVISISDPEHPTEVGHCRTQMAHGVDVSGDYAFVADGILGLKVISIADPTRPTEVGHLDSLGRANGVQVIGSNAFVAADGGGGLSIVSVADPTNPTRIGYYNAPGGFLGVSVLGNCAYLAADSIGLQVVSVTDPTRPVLVGYYNRFDMAYAVEASGNYAYVAEAYYYMGGGLQVYQYYGSAIEETRNDETRAMGRSATVVRGVLFLRGATSLKPQAASLLDISGRKALDLYPGANDVSRLTPGVYFVRQASGAGREASSVTKVVVTR